MPYKFDGVLEDRKEPDFVKFDREGQTAEGALIAISRVEVDGKPAVKYTLETQDGQKIAFLGTHKINVHLSRRDVGHYVYVKFEGENKNVTKNGRAMREFKVRVSPKPVIQVDPNEITDDDIPF